MNRTPNSKREYISQSSLRDLINMEFVIAVQVLDNSTHSANRAADTAMGAAMFGTAGAIVGSALGDQQKGDITVLALCYSGKEYLCEYKPGRDNLLRGWEDNKKMLLPLFKPEWPKVQYDPLRQKEMLASLKKAEIAVWKRIGKITVFFVIVYFIIWLIETRR